MHKGAASGATTRPRHEADSSVRHLKRVKQSGSANLAADSGKGDAQVVTG
jgi:hypothetical protein